MGVVRFFSEQLTSQADEIVDLKRRLEALETKFQQRTTHVVDLFIDIAIETHLSQLPEGPRIYEWLIANKKISVEVVHSDEFQSIPNQIMQYFNTTSIDTAKWEHLRNRIRRACHGLHAPASQTDR